MNNAVLMKMEQNYFFKSGRFGHWSFCLLSSLIADGNFLLVQSESEKCVQIKEMRERHNALSRLQLNELIPFFLHFYSRISLSCIFPDLAVSHLRPQEFGI